MSTHVDLVGVLFMVWGVLTMLIGACIVVQRLQLLADEYEVFVLESGRELRRRIIEVQPRQEREVLLDVDASTGAPPDASSAPAAAPPFSGG